MIKSDKAITMLTLIITVLLLIIITSTLAVNSYDSIQISKITKLGNDIESLNDRIAAYYVEYDDLPICGEAYKKDDLRNKMNKLSNNDGEDYYTIDLSKLDNLTLNYGKDYNSFLEDSYIINVESHIVYYLKGVAYKGEIFYTIGENQEVILQSDL